MARRALYTFSNLPIDKRDEVESAIRKAGGLPFEDPRYPGEVCFHSAKTRKELTLFERLYRRMPKPPTLSCVGRYQCKQNEANCPQAEQAADDAQPVLIQ